MLKSASKGNGIAFIKKLWLDAFAAARLRKPS